jgi:hypothetical protein
MLVGAYGRQIMAKEIKFEDILIPSDETIEKVLGYGPDGEPAYGETKSKLADGHTQKQRIKNIIQSQGKVQPKTNLDNDDDPKPRWR